MTLMGLDGFGELPILTVCLHRIRCWDLGLRHSCYHTPPTLPCNESAPKLCIPLLLLLHVGGARPLSRMDLQTTFEF